MTNLQILETWMQRVWKEQDTKAIEEMFVVNGSAKGLGENMVGPEDFKVFHHQLLQIIDNVEVKVIRHFQDGDWSAALCEMNCTNKKDASQKLQITGTVIGRFENDCIVEAYNHFDFMGLYEQLDLLPAGTFAKCLSGEKMYA